MRVCHNKEWPLMFYFCFVKIYAFHRSGQFPKKPFFNSKEMLSWRWLMHVMSIKEEKKSKLSSLKNKVHQHVE